MKTYHIFLLRHGITKGNEEGRYIGRTDLPLSPQGERQILSMAQKYIYPEAEMYFSSPRKRCIQTLNLIYPDVKPIIVDKFDECDFGDYEGKKLSELKNDTQYQKWAAGGGVDATPNGESSKDFALRTCSAFEVIVDKLMRSGKTTALIMAHGGTIMSILGTYAFPRKPAYEWITGNGSGFELLITPSLWMSARAVEVWRAIPLEADEENIGELNDISGELRRRVDDDSNE